MYTICSGHAMHSSLSTWILLTNIWRFLPWKRQRIANWFKRLHWINQARLFIVSLLLLRTPISAKYCRFGRWLGAWSTPSHTLRNFVIYTFSSYKYTLISEWTRLFGLLRILDNLISGAVCYFCTTISVFREIYTLCMRVVDHAAIVWVGCFFMPSSRVGLVSVPISYGLLLGTIKLVNDTQYAVHSGKACEGTCRIPR